MGKSWRLILSPPGAGAMNMALDEAILEACAERHSPPTLRLYSWDPPCLSLGYAQKAEEVDWHALSLLHWDCVRRPTGGRAILHTDELTYSLSAPHTHPLLAGGVLPSYHRLSQGLVSGLALLGASVEVQAQPPERRSSREPVCFEVPGPYEITVGGRKLIGSAQVRRRHAVLQHGTLPLSGDLCRVCQALRYPDEAGRRAAVARLRNRALTLEEALGRQVLWGEAADALARGFEAVFGLHFERGGPTPAEQEQTRRLLTERYTAEAWTRRV